MQERGKQQGNACCTAVCCIHSHSLYDLPAGRALALTSWTRESWMNAEQRSHVQGIGLGFLAGYVDTLGFVALFGLFTAHVTGNFVLIGSELARPSHGVLLIKFLAFPAFIAGVVIARLLTVALERRGRPTAAYVMSAQWLLLTGFMVAGVMASPIIANTDTPWALVAGMLGAASMGIHNASSKLQF